MGSPESECSLVARILRVLGDVCISPLLFLAEIRDYSQSASCEICASVGGSHAELMQTDHLTCRK